MRRFLRKRLNRRQLAADPSLWLAQVRNQEKLIKDTTMLIKIPDKISKFHAACLAYTIVMHFHYSHYPKRAFNVGFTDDGQDELTGEIQIRIPPIISSSLRESVTHKYEKLKSDLSYHEPSPGNHYRVIPAIERFMFPIADQSDYFLEMLIYCLAKMEATHYIVISNVGCEALENSLRASSLWDELEDELCSQILPSFYVSSKNYIEKFRDIHEKSWELVDTHISPHSSLPLIRNNNPERGTTTKPANLPHQE